LNEEFCKCVDVTNDSYHSFSYLHPPLLLLLNKGLRRVVHKKNLEEQQQQQILLLISFQKAHVEHNAVTYRFGVETENNSNFRSVVMVVCLCDKYV
jgi:hypothetical protein